MFCMESQKVGAEYRSVPVTFSQLLTQWLPCTHHPLIFLTFAASGLFLITKVILLSFSLKWLSLVLSLWALEESLSPHLSALFYILREKKELPKAVFSSG